MTISEAVTKLGIADDWDAVLIGDGSGSNWSRPCGWGTVLMERELFHVEVFAGAMTHGTVNVAELMPYIQAISWYIELLRKRRKAGTSTNFRPRKVIIITDSQYTQQLGNDPNRKLSRRNQAFWGLFSLLERQGVVCEWHHIKRDTMDANHFVDVVSKTARKLIQSANIPKMTEESIGSVDNYNPFTKKGNKRGTRKLDP